MSWKEKETKTSEKPQQQQAPKAGAAASKKQDDNEEPGVRQRRIQDEAEKKGEVPSGLTVNEEGELEEKVSVPAVNDEGEPEKDEEGNQKRTVEVRKVQLR